ncbi:cardiolipin synthase ClsB [Chitinimonas sp.]|uniref:cardiolipin synthase ClsB n=1 Tax=Chitinimonas sp. TaxID=1934313 RepID=UPI0035B275B2
MDYHGNRLQLLCNGREYFPALLAVISTARREVFIESYLFEADDIGRAVSAALIRAARRGVATHLLVDGFGAHGLPPALRRSLQQGGVRLLFFRPEPHFLHLDRQRLRRLHRKLAVIDGHTGFVGGINILADTTDAAGLAPRYDYAVQVNGPLAAEIRKVCASQWRRTAWMQLKPELGRLPPAPPCPPRLGKHSARLVRRDNLRHRRDIEHAYLQAMRNARQEIVLANAYFLPGLTFRHALLAARARGIRVVLLLQGRIDHLLLHYASRVLYRPLLQAGVEIHEYQAGFMHAKVGVIDREWFTVGSSNIDPFSLLTAREANLVARDAQLAGQLRDDIQRHIDHDALAVPQSLLRRGRLITVLSWLAYQLVRLLLGITGYGRREYRE